MRNGVRGLTTPDMNSIARVETVKGPAALLDGQTQPRGVNTTDREYRVDCDTFAQQSQFVGSGGLVF